MLSFSSPFYYLFLGISTFLYYLLPKFQKQILLLASALFIASFSAFALLLFIILHLFTHRMAIEIQRCEKKKERKKRLIAGLAAIASIPIILKAFSNEFTLIEPSKNTFFLLGISFYSLQNIAYLLDVYKHEMKPLANTISFLGYAAFFPKFISGPITSPRIFQNQNESEIKYDSFNIEYGIQRILLGLFKKLVIADRLSAGVSSVFDHHDEMAGITRILAAFMFLVQLYFDFSAYVDIAIGSSRIFGIRLPENFRMPLRATSVSDFWRRWHITLVSWLTNYIYYPVYYSLRKNILLGGIAAIFCTLFVSGIWHGLGATFIVYSGLHAVYLSIEFISRKHKISNLHILPGFLKNALSLILTLSLLSFSMIFFRSSSLSEAFWYLNSIIHTDQFFPKSTLKYLLAPLAVGGHQEDLFNFYVCIGLATLYILFEHSFRFISDFKKFHFLLAFACILLIFLFGVFGDHSRFIYMQF